MSSANDPRNQGHSALHPDPPIRGRNHTSPLKAHRAGDIPHIHVPLATTQDSNSCPFQSFLNTPGDRREETLLQLMTTLWTESFQAALQSAELMSLAVTHASARLDSMECIQLRVALPDSRGPAATFCLELHGFGAGRFIRWIVSDRWKGGLSRIPIHLTLSRASPSLKFGRPGGSRRPSKNHTSRHP